MGELVRYNAAGDLWRLRASCDNSSIIYDNADTSKKYGYYEIMNSAIYQFGNYFAMCIIATEPFTVYREYYNAGSDTWGESESKLFNLLDNGLYGTGVQIQDGYYYGWVTGYGTPSIISHSIPLFYDKEEYNTYIRSPYVAYQWTSVPAISGKNGVLLPMSTLNDINDGNEVTTSDTSKFNLNDRSNIKNLVDAVVNDF